MKLISTYLILFLSFPLPATELTGEWRGKGEISTVGYEAKCETINLSIKQEKKLIELQIFYLCPDYKEVFPRTLLQVEGNQLFIESELVGALNANGLSIERMGGRYSLWLIKKDNALFFRELLASRYDFTMIEGDLKYEQNN